MSLAGVLSSTSSCIFLSANGTLLMEDKNLAQLILQQDPENAPHVALVISPLRALIRDQVSSARNAGVRAVGILRLEEMSQDDIRGRAEYKNNSDLFYGAPNEFILNSRTKNVSEARIFGKLSFTCKLFSAETVPIFGPAI